MQPDKDFMQRDFEQAQWLKQRPVCDCCGEAIQDESFHRIMGEVICDSCLDGMIEFVED